MGDVVKLGIGVTTYNRSGIVRETIEGIAKHTRHPHDLIVCDDGSTDDTVAALESVGVGHIAGANRGVAWNKNRCLVYLFLVRGCDVVVLLEDDTRPSGAGWEADWIAAANLYGHANFATPWIADLTSGSGTPADPYLSPWCSGQCTVFSRAAIAAAGFMDTRFGRFGAEHVEHTLRLTRLGYGGGPGPQDKILLRSALTVADCDTTGTEAEVRASKELYVRLRRKRPRFVLPFRSMGELGVIRDEMRSARRFARPDTELRAARISRASLAADLLGLRLGRSRRT